MRQLLIGMETQAMIDCLLKLTKIKGEGKLLALTEHFVNGRGIGAAAACADIPQPKVTLVSDILNVVAGVCEEYHELRLKQLGGVKRVIERNLIEKLLHDEELQSNSSDAVTITEYLKGKRTERDPVKFAKTYDFSYKVELTRGTKRGTDRCTGFSTREAAETAKALIASDYSLEPEDVEIISIVDARKAMKDVSFN